MADLSTKFPVFPPAFGQDGGKFLKHYDQLADELDEDMTKTIKENLDGMLIFAGLFAGVNSGFLTLTLPRMSADPSDDTNALLLQLVQGAGNSANAPRLPSADFAPPSDIFIVNILFSLSLTCAVAASFFAVLGRQWLMYYHRGSGQTNDKRRFEQLLRSQAAERWGLVPILDIVLPTLLQLALAVFGVGLILYLYSLGAVLAYAPLALLSAALAGLILSVGFCLWDPFCPFKTPASQVVAFVASALPSKRIASWWAVATKRSSGLIRRQSYESKGEEHSLHDLSQNSSQQENKHLRGQRGTHPTIHRAVRDPKVLRADLVRRVLTISEDKNALYHTALNLSAVRDPVTLGRVISDDVGVERLRNLYLEAQARWSTDGDAVRREAIAYGTALMHIVLSVGSLTHLLPPESRDQLIQNPDSTFWRPTVNSKLLNFLGELEDHLRVDRVEQTQASQRSQFLFIASRALQVIAPWGWMTKGDLYVLHSYILAFELPPWPALSWLALTIKLSTRRISDSGNRLPTMTPLSWALENFTKIQRMYRGVQDTRSICEDVMESLRTITKSWPQKPPNDVYFNLIRSLCQAENETGIFTRSSLNVGAEIPELLTSLLVSIESNIRRSPPTVDQSKERSLRQDCLRFLGAELDQPWPSIAWTAASVTQYLKFVMRMGQSTENDLILEALRNLVDCIKLVRSESRSGLENEDSIWRIPDGEELRLQLSKVYRQFEAFVTRNDVAEINPPVPGISLRAESTLGGTREREPSVHEPPDSTTELSSVTS
ncbi:hypothetical protein M407DRAFT_23722 [Tulasnella calospora MUT 4182]|uniref:DUF6535 domain-containing protein n=1 Tax=Tulasnella calospora MUT 4182 TaxID=1051891 RepID=A0A0C3M063_9AGAM|nr:hypothetical protein M407DRAFT_23722 [Tulasnella calospora MUT 4182]